MTLREYSELAQASVYTFHDDSRHARVVLGPGFSMPHYGGGTDGIEMQGDWTPLPSAFTMETLHPLTGARHWYVVLEECAMPMTRFRIAVGDTEGQVACRYEVRDDFAILCEPEDVMAVLPESVFGAVLGAAVGATEVKKLMTDRLQRRLELEKPGLETPRSDWRAPRFSFTLRTATGSPFAERWGFAIQEAVSTRNGFRIWIEQQRTGREIYLRLRSDGSIEGIHELEQLPAAVHGAGLGMVLMFHHAGKRMEQLSGEGAMRPQPLRQTALQGRQMLAMQGGE